MVQETIISRLTKENQRLFINTTEISGVQSVQAQYSIAEKPLKFLGMRQAPIIAQGNQGGSIGINSLLITEDNFIQYTGDFGLNGYVLKDNKSVSGNFSFTSGYLTSYSLKCSVGQIPEIAVGINVLGNIGYLNYGESAQVSGDFNVIATGVTDTPLQIAAPGAIDLTLGEFSTNRVTSFEVSINVPRNAIYALGMTTPVNVFINYPIQVDCMIQFEIFDYQASNLRRFKCSPKIQDIGIALKSFDSDASILDFFFNDMTLVGESHSANVDGNVIVQAKYRTYITRS